MQICWDSLENIIFTKGGNFRVNNHTLYEYDSCLECGESYIGRIGSKYCDFECGMKSESYKHNMSNKMKDRVITITHRNNISEAKKGKPFTIEHRNNISEAKKGECCGSLNPNWRDGASYELYCEEWTDKEYVHWLKYERDNGKCQNPCCKRRHTVLNLHHINYDKKDCRPSNLITLCVSCNSIANFNREWYESWYTTLMTKRI
jgi:hypothetical protein